MPKALAHDAKEGAPHLVVAQRGKAGVKFSQGGWFDPDILCDVHERITGDLDRYGVDFVRRARVIDAGHNGGATIDVPNPSPDTLRRFALSVIWREIVSENGAKRGKGLGKRTAEFRDAVFAGGLTTAPIFVSLPKFTAGSDAAVPFGLHPFQIRLMGRIAWSFTIAGCAFHVGTDSQGFPSRFDYLRADTSDPARVLIGDAQDIRTVGILKPLLREMVDIPAKKLTS
jgi:hypothetical protein